MPNTSVFSSLTVMYFPRCSSRRSGAQPTAVSGSCLVPARHRLFRERTTLTLFCQLIPPFPEHGDCRGQEPQLLQQLLRTAPQVVMLEVILPVALSADRKGLSSALRADTGFRLIFSKQEAYTLSPVCVSDTTLSATFFSSVQTSAFSVSVQRGPY